jgi:hypothetical protein
MVEYDSRFESWWSQGTKLRDRFLGTSYCELLARGNSVDHLAAMVAKITNADLGKGVDSSLPTPPRLQSHLSRK